jgi:hypothetical protein
MKNMNRFRMLAALSLVVAPLWVQAQIPAIFTDNFSNGSTTNELSIPGGTTNASFTSYDIASVKNGISDTFIQPNDLRLALSTTTSSGFLEAQALFTTNAFNLNAVGDYIDIAVVFTNTTGTVLVPSISSALWLGLYNSGDTPGTDTNVPVSGGGLANTGLNVASSFASGNCQPWQGYVGQITPGGGTLVTRPVQLVSGNNSVNQELLAPAGITGDYQHPNGTGLQNVAGTTPPAVGSLLTNVAYTLDLRITVAGNAYYTVSNALYQGNSTAGTLLYSQIGAASTTNSTFLTSSFDGLAVGIRASGSPNTDPLMDISSILITGTNTPVTGPPTILTQPSAVQVATNGSCDFSVFAAGDQVTYQWRRNNTNLLNGGNISGATTPMLIVNNCTTADQFSGNSGYYCDVSGANNYSIDTVTNPLTLQPATNLIWTTSGGTWDVATTASWDDTNGNQQVFNFGDPVVFNDTSAGPINLSGSFLSASSVTVATVANSYTFQGGGSIAGPGSFIYSGSGRLTLNAANTYTGGTIISNAAANIFMENYQFFGTGPLILAGGGQMEVDQLGGINTGFQGNIIIASNFTMTVDEDNAFGVVFLSDISGTYGQTLTFSPGVNNAETNINYRVRTYGSATVCNAGLDLNDPNLIFAPSMNSGTETYSGIISGSGAVYNDSKGLVVLNAQNTYIGGTVPAEGATGLGVSSEGSPTVTSGPLGTGPLNLTSDSSSLNASAVILASANNITVANPIEYPSGTNNFELEVGGANNLTFSGPFTLNGNDGLFTNTFPSRMLQVTNTGITTFSGVISDGGVGGNDYGLSVSSNGTNYYSTLILSGNETYTGPTTNAGAILLINGQLASTAVVYVTNNGILGGTGTISGPVIVCTNSAVTAGTAVSSGVLGIGTLDINNSLTFQGGGKAIIQVNNPQNDAVAVSGAITYNGILNATNTGSAIAAGTQFHIFTAGSESGNFTSITGTPGPNQAWTFNPATGILSVSNTLTTFTVSPGITNIVLLSGTNVTISGTNGQSGDTYYLLTSTNLLTPMNQWKPVSTNVATGSFFSFTATNAVNRNDSQQFFRFANTNF